MKPFFFSLRFRLISLVFLAMLPAMGLAVYNADLLTEKAFKDDQEELLRLSHLAAMEHEIILVDTEQLLTTLAELNKLRPERAEECNALLARLMALNPLYASLGVADREGAVFCSGVTLSAPVNLGDRAWFQEAVSQRDFAASEYLVGRLTGKPIIAFSYPVVDQGKVIAVVFASIDLGWLERHAHGYALPEGAVFTFVDHRGTVLARVPEGEKWIGQPSPEDSVVTLALAAGREGLAEAKGLDGVKRVYAYTPVFVDGAPSAYIIIGKQHSLLYAEAYRSLRYNLGILAGVTLLAVLAAWLGHEAFLLRRLNALVAATRRIAQGDLRARTGVKYGLGELSQLALAFDEMAASLEEQVLRRQNAEQKERAAERLYRLLFEESPDAIFILDLEGRHLQANPSAAEMLSYTPEELQGLTARVISTELAESERILEGLLKGEHIPPYERLFRKKNGDLVPVELHVNLIRDESGKPLYIQSIARDISERVQAQEMLRKRKQELEALFNLSIRLRSAQTTREALPVLLAEVRLALHADASLVVLHDAEGEVFTIVEADGHLAANVGRKFSIEEGLSGQVLRTRQPYVSADYASEETRLVNLDQAVETGPAALVPLQSEDTLLGVLMVARQRHSQVQTFSPDEVSLLAGMGEIAGNALWRIELYAHALRRLRHVQALRNIDMAITASLDPRVTLRVLLDEVTTQLEVDAAAVMLLNPQTQTLEFTAGRGFRSKAIERSRVRLGQGYTGRAALERRTLNAAVLEQADDLTRSRLLEEEGFVAYAVAPMISKGKVLGVLETFHRSPNPATSEWQELLEAMAWQAAIAIDNARLFTDLEHSNVELRLAYDATIEGWSRAMDLRDKETEGHTQRVTELTVHLARLVGMSEEKIVHVRRGALLHDIGKMGIPDEILHKPGALSDEEWEMMRKHPQFAYEMLAPIAYLKHALDIPYCHHEKWDGSGYPRGLAREQIPLAARIFAVADVFDALTSDRPYRKAWSRQEALKHIREQAGKQALRSGRGRGVLSHPGGVARRTLGVCRVLAGDSFSDERSEEESPRRRRITACYSDYVSRL